MAGTEVEAATKDNAAEEEKDKSAPGSRGKPPGMSKRTVALHTGYVGTGYKGSSINRTLGEDMTIEQILEKAIFKAGMVLESNFGSFQRMRWSRASRTDKGVHSLGTVMALAMLVNDEMYTLPPDYFEKQRAERGRGRGRGGRSGGRGGGREAEGQAKEAAGQGTAAAAATTQGDTNGTAAEAGAEAGHSARATSATTAEAPSAAGVGPQPMLVDAAKPTQAPGTHQEPGQKDQDVAAGAGKEPKEGESTSAAAVGPDFEGISAADRINEHLPPHIRVFTVQKVSKRFDARHMCNSRTYEYYLPATMLSLKCDGSEDDAQKLAVFRRALGLFVGYHPFHNYTRRHHHETNRLVRKRDRKWAAEGRQEGEEGAGEDKDTSGGAGQDAAPVKADTEAAATEAMDTGTTAAGTGSAEDADAAGQGPQAEAAATAGMETGGPSAENGSRKRGREDQGPQQQQQQQQRKKQSRGDDDDDEKMGPQEQEQEDEEEEEEGGGQGEAANDSDDDAMEALMAQAASAGEGGAGDDEASRAAKRQRVPASMRPELRFTTTVDPNDTVTKTFYRHIESFTAEDPKPLIEGGTPCLLLRVKGQSFMIHHIRHMIGTAVAVAQGLMSEDLVNGTLMAPSRAKLPRAPPHTLLLADCEFLPFVKQKGPGNNDLIHVTGRQLSLREQGQARKEVFREQVLLPALQKLVELPEWHKWLASMQLVYPHPPEQAAEFEELSKAWVARMAARREQRIALGLPVGRRGDGKVQWRGRGGRGQGRGEGRAEGATGGAEAEGGAQQEEGQEQGADRDQQSQEQGGQEKGQQGGEGGEGGGGDAGGHRGRGGGGWGRGRGRGGWRGGGGGRGVRGGRRGGKGRGGSGGGGE